MIRISLALLVALTTFSAAVKAGPAPLLCFERGPDIWVAHIDGSDAKKIARGSAPNLSPDGARIAFHTDTSTKKDVIRQIAVVDVASRKTTVFKNEIPSQNCQRAIWSPDGSHIIFSIWADNDWHLALINADGTGFRYFKKTFPKGSSLWSFCWAPDGQSVYAQDLNSLYQFDSTGAELKKWSLQKLFPHGSFNSGSSFSVSPDGKTLLMEVDMDEEETNLPDWDGPPPSLWTLDLGSENTARVTPKGVLAWDGCWLDGNNIVFVSQAREKEPSLWKMNLAGKEHKVLLRNGNNPSVSH